MKEMHSLKRFICPLKSCDYTTKRQGMLPVHWNNKHSGLRFPEPREGNEFTQRIDATNQENLEKVYGFNIFNASP